MAAAASVGEAAVPAAAGLAGFWAHGVCRLVAAAAIQGMAIADVSVRLGWFGNCVGGGV